MNAAFKPLAASNLPVSICWLPTVKCNGRQQTIEWLVFGTAPAKIAPVLYSFSHNLDFHNQREKDP